MICRASERSSAAGRRVYQLPPRDGGFTSCSTGQWRRRRPPSLRLRSIKGNASIPPKITCPGTVSSAGKGPNEICGNADAARMRSVPLGIRCLVAAYLLLVENSVETEMACQSFNHGQENCAGTLCGDKMEANQIYSMAVVINLLPKKIEKPPPGNACKELCCFCVGSVTMPGRCENT